MRRLAQALAAALAVTATASGSWSAAAGGSAAARATTIGGGSTPSATVPTLSSNVTVSWSAASNATGYIVRRYDATTGAAQSIRAGCSGTVAGLSCTENGVPVGVWTYAVTPAAGAWRGTESARSSSVTVPGL